jgi:hypothetical protein
VVHNSVLCPIVCSRIRSISLLTPVVACSLFEVTSKFTQVSDWLIRLLDDLFYTSKYNYHPLRTSSDVSYYTVIITPCTLLISVKSSVPFVGCELASTLIRATLRTLNSKLTVLIKAGLL